MGFNIDSKPRLYLDRGGPLVEAYVHALKTTGTADQDRLVEFIG